MQLPPPASPAIRTKSVLLIAGIVFVAFNLRAPITSVGPLIDFIRSDMGISNGFMGLLTTLPLLAFAILSPVAPSWGERFGGETAVMIGLVLIGAGILIRSAGLLFGLLAGTALIGFGIALGNVLLPSVVKRRFPNHMGWMTGIYTSSMSLFASISSGISHPLAEHLHWGWQLSLAVWIVLCGIAILIWMPQLRGQSRASISAVPARDRQSLLRSPIAWQVTLFMGLQSFLYYCMVAWLPAILQQHGLSFATAGWFLATMQLTSIPVTLITPVLADRLNDQRAIVAGIGVLLAIGLYGLWFGGGLLLLTICTVALGSALGASISLALTLIGLRTKTDGQTARLSGMAQSIGYLLAAIGPITLGFLFDSFHSWVPALLLCIAVSLMMMAFGFGAGRNRYVLPAETN